MQPTVERDELRARRVDHGDAGFAQQGQRGGGTAVNELRAELDRDGQPGNALRLAATPDAFSRLHHEHRATGARERHRGGEARGAGADYEDVDLNRRTSQGAISSSAVMARSVAEIGWVTNTETAPWLMESARRNGVSASGARIRPITAGPTGMSQRRMAKPSSPKT